MSPEEEFFQRHFGRMDRELAASFTPEQRRAIWRMFGAQPAADHRIAVRRSVSLFGRRFYIAFFAGPEKRSRTRLVEDGMLSRGCNAAAAALGTLVLAAPVALLAYVLVGAIGGDGAGDTDVVAAFWEQVAVFVGGR